MTAYFVSNSIPPFKGQASGAAKTSDETKVEQDFLKCFFPDELFEFTARETDRYGFAKHHPPLSDIWEETNISEIKQYFGIRIYMSLVQLPDMKMYWKRDDLFGGFAIADVMSRDRFLKLTRCLHVANNEEVDTTDKLFCCCER